MQIANKEVMPTVYRAECACCGQSPEINSGIAGWVTTDGRKGGKILPDGYLALKLDNGEYVALPHPIESSVLQEHGFTWIKASRQSRLLCVTFKICAQCGIIQEERQHQDFRSGCLVGLICAAGSVVLLKFWFNRDWGYAFSMCFPVTMIVFGLITFVNWARWWNRNQKLKLKECLVCGGHEFKTISQAKGKPLPCPACKTMNMRYTIAGKS